jgi:hypothetical protein
MKRDYSTGEADDAVFFFGIEIEKTPAYGMPTLFVTGVHSSDVIEKHMIEQDVTHIFFGANHSFHPTVDSFDEWAEWESMILPFLKQGTLCTLDIPLSHVETFNDSPFNEYDNFIPQIRVPIPYIRLWNYNTMLKIDDKDFKATNPGVWCHSLHDLMDRSKFTEWSQYSEDEVIK